MTLEDGYNKDGSDDMEGGRGGRDEGKKENDCKEEDRKANQGKQKTSVEGRG